MPAGFYKPETISPYKRFFLYGPPKTVKTPLALAYGAYLHSLNPKSRTLYIAADGGGAEDLPSLPDPSWREFIDVWKFGSPLDKDHDAYKEVTVCASTDWKKVNPEYELIIWDTFTMSMEDVLQHIATKEYFAGASGSKHIVFGDPTLPKGHLARLVIPLPADYNGANGIAKRVINCLRAQETHLLLINHETEIKDEKGVTRIGPAFVGNALTGKLPGWLTGLIYTDKRGEVDPNTGKIKPTLYVCSDPADDVHIAGVRHEPINGDPKNPIPKVKVGNDLVAYWKLFFEALFPQESLTTGAK